MNRDEILTMPAGWELNALVAERVFGRSWAVHGGRYVWRDRESAGAAYSPYEPMPAFSTDLAAAFQVVEAMRGREVRSGYGDCCRHFGLDTPDISDESPWCAGWHDYAGGERIDSVEARAETAPLAICRAALLATLLPEAKMRDEP